MALLEIAGASKRFGATAAVDNVSLTVKRGAFYALLGGGEIHQLHQMCGEIGGGVEYCSKKTLGQARMSTFVDTRLAIWGGKAGEKDFLTLIGVRFRL